MVPVHLASFPLARTIKNSRALRRAAPPRCDRRSFLNFYISLTPAETSVPYKLGGKSVNSTQQIETILDARSCCPLSVCLCVRAFLPSVDHASRPRFHLRCLPRPSTSISVSAVAAAAGGHGWGRFVASPEVNTRVPWFGTLGRRNLKGTKAPTWCRAYPPPPSPATTPLSRD